MALRPPVVVFAVVVEIFVTMTTGLGDKLVMFIRFTQSILFTHTHTRTLLSLNCDQEEKARKPERTDPLQWQGVWNLLPSCHPLQGHAASADKALARVIWNNPWSVKALIHSWKEKVRGTMCEMEILRDRTICEKHHSWREKCASWQFSKYFQECGPNIVLAIPLRQVLFIYLF